VGLTRRGLLAQLAAATTPGTAAAAILSREDDAAAGRATPSPQGQPSAAYAPLPAGAPPFATGEFLRYGVSFEGFSAGEAALAVVGATTIGGLSGLLVRYTAETRGLVATFYRLRDRIEALLDPKLLFTQRYESWSEQRRRRRHRIVTFEPEAGRFVRVEVGGDTTTGPLDREVVEGVGLVYYLRAGPLEPGRRVSVPLYRRQEITVVTFGVSRPLLTETPAGRFETVEVKPVASDQLGDDEEARTTVDGGLFGGAGSMWFTNDARRIPVRMVGSARFGSIDARLTGADLPRS
jgi:Protein of unknown function (DUF3108)